MLRVNDPHLRAWADPLARRLGFYTAYTVTEAEYIGTGDDNLRNWILNTYDRPPRVLGVSLEAAKYHWDTGDVHDFSVRLVDAYDTRMQYHIHGWEKDVATYDIASHYEYRPDLRILSGETPTDAIERLRTHYRPQWGEDYLRGEAPSELRAKL